MASIPAEKAPKPGLNIYGYAAVNPTKLTIAAEELGIPYNFINLDIRAGELSSKWYRAINPNGHAPAIVHVKDDGTSVTVFESAACLLYMAGEFGKEDKLSFPVGTQEYWDQLSWLSWQVAGYGPMMGQSCHFSRYAAEDVPYGSWRYTAEARRLNSVLDQRLSTSPFVAGDRLTIADIAVFSYANSAKWCNVDVDEFPNVKLWRDKLLGRPAFQRGLQVPVPYQFNDAAVSDPDSQFYSMIRKVGGQMIKGATEKWTGEGVPLPSDHANYQ